LKGKMKSDIAKLDPIIVILMVISI